MRINLRHIMLNESYILYDSIYKTAWKRHSWQYLINKCACPMTPRYTLRRNECICSPRDMHKNVHSSFIHSLSKLEMTQLEWIHWSRETQNLYKFPSNPWLTPKLHTYRVRLRNAAKATDGALGSLADILSGYSVGDTKFGIQVPGSWKGSVNSPGFPPKLRRAVF